MTSAVKVLDAYKSHPAINGNQLLDWVFQHLDEPKTPVAYRRSYQPLLRALGCWLDGKRACNVNLMETAAGFIIRHGVEDDPLSLEKYILTHGELEHLEAAMRERRGMQPAGRYQDFFRALGYEIDAQEGTHLLLDQIEDTYFFTVYCRDVRGGLVPLKRGRILTPSDQATILRRAHARRRPPEPRRHFWQRVLHRRPVAVRAG